ncbi:DUF7344 domain-containing protein [Halosegnis longus]|uniref:DUF7344 domain-containing protein n=2 Tax=Halosegnis longus TaxID=2216012 RepID=A0AAJ4UWG9_9EURY|nr:hypothetical protein Nmn1133_10790 [Salella cibi]
METTGNQQVGGVYKESDNHIPEGDLFDALSNRRRRYALQALMGTDGVELGMLAEQVAAWELEKEISAVDSTERKRVYTSLQQSHLPRLDDAGLVRFDKRAGIVEPTPGLEECEVYLDVVRGNDIPWSEYYLGLAGLGVALTAAVAVDAYPFVLLPDVAWLAALAVTIAVSALYHTHYAARTRLGRGETPTEMDR